MPEPFDLIVPLLYGLKVTLLVFAGGAVVAVVAAFAAGLGRTSRDPVLRAICGVYVEVFRGTSALVQLFWFFFVLPQMFEVRLDPVSTGILVLGLNIGAYGAEVVRGALLAVPQSQRQAAVALNLTRWQTVRYVLLPQALPAMLPPFGNLAVELLKSTALVSLISATDLSWAGEMIKNQDPRTTQIFGMLLIMYFLLAWPIGGGMRMLERTLRRRTGQEVRE